MDAKVPRRRNKNGGIVGKGRYEILRMPRRHERIADLQEIQEECTVFGPLKDYRRIMGLAPLLLTTIPLQIVSQDCFHLLYEAARIFLETR